VVVQTTRSSKSIPDSTREGGGNVTSDKKIGRMTDKNQKKKVRGGKREEKARTGRKSGLSTGKIRWAAMKRLALPRWRERKGVPEETKALGWTYQSQQREERGSYVASGQRGGGGEGETG